MASETLFAALDSGDPKLLASAAVTNFLGFLGYGLSVHSMATKGKDLLPFWVHVFYLAHDSSCAVHCLMAAAERDWHWFFTIYGVGLFVWTFQEIFVIIHSVTNEAHRRDIWGGSTTLSQAAGSALRQVVMWYAVVNLLLKFFEKGEPMFDIFVFTNIVWVLGPSEAWRTRPSREWCGGIRFQVISIITIANTFAPWNMWALARPDLYDVSWFHITGGVCVAISLANFFWVLSLPEREPEHAKLSERVNGKANGKKELKQR